jgi:DNA topoisomerase IB
LQTLAQFDMARVGAEVADAAKQRSAAEREVSDSAQRCESTAGELRSVSGQSPLNPALLAAVLAIYRTERRVLEEWQGRLAHSQQREQQARSKLAGLRNRERSLERALQAERRKRQLEQQVQNVALADELWLQQVWREKA